MFLYTLVYTRYRLQKKKLVVVKENHCLPLNIKQNMHNIKKECLI